MAGIKCEMRAEKGADFSAVKKTLLEQLSGMGAELICDVEHSTDATKNCLLVFEKFYFRIGGYVSLTILLTENDEGQIADIVGSGGGAGIENWSWGANTNFAEAPINILKEFGFVRESY